MVRFIRTAKCTSQYTAADPIFLEDEAGAVVDILFVGADGEDSLQGQSIDVIGLGPGGWGTIGSVEGAILGFDRQHHVSFEHVG